MKNARSIAGGALFALLAFAGPAAAAGCGGYVNLAVWGCAPWDNNPPKAGVTPGYRAPAPRPAPRPVVQPKPTPGLISNNRGGLISDRGGGLVGNAGGTLVGNDGASRRPPTR